MIADDFNLTWRLGGKKIKLNQEASHKMRYFAPALDRAAKMTYAQ
jgi:hypothetical protein